MKNPLTLAGIETVTFRFVAQQLNHCVTLPRSPPPNTDVKNGRSCTFSPHTPSWRKEGLNLRLLSLLCVTLHHAIYFWASLWQQCYPVSQNDPRKSPNIVKVLLYSRSQRECVHTLSCLFMYCSFASIGHAAITWSTVSSNCWQSLHLLSVSVFNIFVA